jgi:hypothetical protein
MRHICMVPSNTLSSTDAGKFALKIVESPIILDYLSETHGVPVLLVAHVPNEEDWWDTVSKHSYADVLSKRHKGKPSYGALMADKNLRWPDLSTFNGPSLLRFAFGDALMRPPITTPKRRSGRSEIYEIKPNNRRGKKAALDKLFDVEESYRKYGISGIYDRGAAYPFAFKKTIYLETPYLDLFRYLVTLGLKPLGVRVDSVSLEVTRAEAGALLYKICVDLEGADAYQKDSAWVMANFAVRMLWLAHTSHEKQEVRAAAMLFVETFEPDDTAVNPRQVEKVIAGHDLSKLPALKINIIKMVSEMDSSINAIRDAMYSRLIGAPGDRIFICSDEAWYQANIGLPGAAKVAAQIKTLTLGGGLGTAKGLSFLGLSLPVLLTADRAMAAIPLIGPAYRWAMDHIGAVLIVAGCSIVVTAAVIAAVVSDGTAAPVAVPVAGEALSAAAAAVAGAGEMTGAVMAASGATAQSTALAAVGTAEEGIAGVRGAIGLVNWARQAVQLGATATELGQAGAQSVADELLLKILTEAAVKAAVEVALKGVVPVVASATLIGLSARPVYAYTGPSSGTVSVAGIGELVQVEIGHLYTIRVNKAVRTQLPAIPELYKNFDIGDYTLSASNSANSQVRMLGCVDVL